MRRPTLRPAAEPAAGPGSASLWGAIALALLLGVAAPAALAQEAEEAAVPGELPGDEPAVPDIDAILEGEEALTGDTGYTYDAGGRRDPFRSLLETQDLERRGPRPEGVPGLLIDEITITGIFETPRGWVVQVRAADQGKSFLIREGDQVYDGEVVSIGANEVVFRQVVQDPTALKPFQEVVKKLNP